MKVRLTTWYEFRTPVITGTIVSQMQRDHIDGLLDSLMVDSF